MRDGAPDEVMSTAYRWRSTIQAWSPTGDLLAEDVPITSGQLSWDVTGRNVPEQCSFTVPRYTVVDGARYDWLPKADVNHPLATFGQTITISVTITSLVSATEWVIDLARLRIENWVESDNGASLQVSAVGLLQAAADDVLPVPQSPDGEATLVSEFARLLPGALSVDADAITDRPALPGTQWAGSKIDALYDIADALPARLRTSADGGVLLLPTLAEQPIPTAIYRDGERNAGNGMATLVSAPRADTRQGIVNSVTVLSNYTGDSGTQATVTVEQTTGPFAVDTYGRVGETWSSEQIGSEDEALAAGQERLATGLRPARTLNVSTAPDPRLEVDDPVLVVWDSVERTGYVLGVTLDLTGEAEMVITMSIASEAEVVPGREPSDLRFYGQGTYNSGVYGY